jgi:hypothetical protein
MRGRWRWHGQRPEHEEPYHERAPPGLAAASEVVDLFVAHTTSRRADTPDWSTRTITATIPE